MRKETLIINNFKCFQHLEIAFPALSVLVGSNGMGKSTVIQSLLLMRCAKEADRGAVKLNGPYGLALGTNESVINQFAKVNRIDFSLKDYTGKKLTGVRLRGDNREERLDLRLDKRYTNTDYKRGLFANEFYFLSAERTGPRITQKMEPLDYLQTGPFGEFTGQVMSEKFFKIDPERGHPSCQSLNLPAQVNAWMNDLFPGVEVIAEKSISMQACQVKIRNEYTLSYVESTNIGFGISYSLPIIVEGLIAKRDSYFIVENPEAHLHPAAQTEMGKFLAMLSRNGLRVIIETHSDHLLDGIQLYLAKHLEMRGEVVVYHFGMDNFRQPDIDAITYDEQLDYTKWPKGFMDQTSINYMHLTESR